MSTAQTSWQPPAELPDLRRTGIIALDTETSDEGLRADLGPGWPWHGGYVCGVSVAYHADGGIRAHYFPLRHPDSENFDPEQVFQWLRDHTDSNVRFVTQNGLYDWGWLRTEAGIKMPPGERLEEIGALATIVDENRRSYSLASLCAWRGLPGKDETLLKQAVKAAGFKVTKKSPLQSYICQLPAHLVGPYAEADAANTLALFESVDPVLDKEGTRAAYRLEVDLLPMVHEMRRRGIRIDTAAAEQARDLLLQKRDATLAELSEKLGVRVSIEEISRNRWLVQTFDAQGITYPYTQKGTPSFTAGTTGWMHKHLHWLPRLIVKADKANNAATKFLETYILGHAVNGRVHAEIHPHRSDDGGTRSLRFSYSDPPLQQMTAHDEELAPLIRGVFLPEEGEVWAKPDVSQQEFRLIVHYAVAQGLRKAREAAERYRTDPNTDFHQLVSDWTGLERASAKNTNFAKAFGAGVRKFAAMIGKPEGEARAIYAKYDRELPFVLQLAARCQNTAVKQGYLELYDGARRHWDAWEAPQIAWSNGMGPCSREEAERRVANPNHPWHRRWIRRAETHKGMNALIQGSAARHTKLWMRACWREGIVPLLQMHDALDCSVESPELAERVAQLGREAVTLEVPMQVDLKFGRSWGDAKHTWEDAAAAGDRAH
jgi:DNA polymerase-1